jgi:16S rRNA C1402 (ribose-2'-O) methylase RsmI
MSQSMERQQATFEGYDEKHLQERRPRGTTATKREKEPTRIPTPHDRRIPATLEDDERWAPKQHKLK